MKKLLILLMLIITSLPIFSRPFYFAEDFYQLFYQKLYMYPLDYNATIYFLERAYAAPFINPLYALAKIETEEEYERYRLLFKMHVNLKLVEQYRHLAAKYQKQNAYFYNILWADENLKSLEIAENYFHIARHYWKKAKEYSQEAISIRIFPQEIQNWSDENYRIEVGDLDYDLILDLDLQRIERVREDFLRMLDGN